MLAVDFESEELVQRIVKQSLENGVITFWFLSHPASFRLAPPLISTEEELNQAGSKIRESIESAVAEG